MVTTHPCSVEQSHSLPARSESGSATSDQTPSDYLSPKISGSLLFKVLDGRLSRLEDYYQLRSTLIHSSGLSYVGFVPVEPVLDSFEEIKSERTPSGER